MALWVEVIVRGRCSACDVTELQSQLEWVLLLRAHENPSPIPLITTPRWYSGVDEYYQPLTSRIAAAAGMPVPGPPKRRFDCWHKTYHHQATENVFKFTP